MRDSFLNFLNVSAWIGGRRAVEVGFLDGSIAGHSAGAVPDALPLQPLSTEDLSRTTLPSSEESPIGSEPGHSSHTPYAAALNSTVAVTYAEWTQTEISDYHRDSQPGHEAPADQETSRIEGISATDLEAALRPFADNLHGIHHSPLADHFGRFEFEPRSNDHSLVADPMGADGADDVLPPIVDGSSSIHDLFVAHAGSADLASTDANAGAATSDTSTLLLCGCPACVAARQHGQESNDSNHFQAGDLSPAAVGSGGAAAAAPAAPSYAIDALVNEYDYQWGSGGLGSPATVTYSFLTSVPNYYASNAPERVNFVPMDAAQMAVVRQALADYSHVANINFVEVAGVGSITFGTANLGSGIGGWAYYPYPNYSGPSDNYLTGDVWITNLYSSYANPTLGSWEYMSFIHEIGHAIGMKHPGNYDAGGGGTPGPYLPTAEDNHQYTVMSYYSGPTYGGNEPITPQLYDVATIQYLYGANTSYHAGNDTYTFSTSTQVETIWDGGGNDTFDASNQSQAVTIDLHGGSFSSIGGVNNIAIAYGATIETAIGGNANDVLIANDAGSTLNGGAGADQLIGGAGNDILIGGGGNDTISSGGGNDTFIVAASGGADIITDFIAGLSSLDIIDLTAIASIHSLAQLLAVSIQSGLNTVINLGGGNSLTLQNVVETNLIAGDFVFAPSSNHSPTGILLSNDAVAEGSADGTLIGHLSALDPDPGDTFSFSLIDSAGGKFVLSGTDLFVAAGLHGTSFDIGVRVTDSAANTFDQPLSIDILHTLGNSITGTAGSDLIDAVHTPAGQPYATAQSDTIYGNAGNDSIDGLGGGDVMYGGTGNDVYVFDNPGDYAGENPGDGIDEIQTYSAQQYLGPNFENLTGLSALGQRLAGNGIDNIIIGYTGNDVITGGDGNDTIKGNGGADILYGDNGNDTIDGGDGNDIAYGGAGNDSMYGGIGDDIFSGDDGNDMIYGGDGIDRLHGNAGNDFVYGDAGNDLLYGEAGDDFIDGGSGIDSMSGGFGNDIFRFDNPGDYAAENAGEGTDEVQTYNATQFLGANIENLTGLSAAGQRLAGNALDNVITGNFGDDTITSSDGNDTIRAGGGNDRAYGEAGNDRIDGEAGNDVLYGNDGNDFLHGGTGTDVLFGGNGNDVFIFAAADFQSGVRDTIADFHSVAGADFDVLELEGAAADYSFVDFASYTLITQIATGGSIQLNGTTHSAIADQISYVAAATHI